MKRAMSESEVEEACLGMLKDLGLHHPPWSGYFLGEENALYPAKISKSSSSSKSGFSRKDLRLPQKNVLMGSMLCPSG
jgi:hypothetical protein